MSIWNKVLIGFIFIGLAVFFYLSCRVLALHANWRASANSHQKKIEDDIKATNILIHGDPEDETFLGITKANLHLHHVLMNRGRVWYSVTPEEVLAADEVKVSVTVDSPDPHQISVQTTVQIFEDLEAADGGKYLGEFTVFAVADKKLELAPSRKLRPKAVERLQASQGTWTLYEIMPADDPKIIASLPVDELKAALPESVVAEYLDSEGKIREDLQKHDYEVLFRLGHRRYVLLSNKVKSLTDDLALITEGVSEAESQLSFRDTEIADLKIELAKEKRKLDEVVAHRKTLEASVASIKETNQQLIDTNHRLTSAIANAQKKASQIINARTRNVAQADMKR